jgi:glycerol kinase
MVLWDRSTGRIHNAIVWQDRRTAEQCEACAPGATGMAAEKAGRLIAPYVSVT